MHRRQKVIALNLIALAVAVFVYSGCRAPVEPETPDYVEYGWDLMAEGEYRAAITEFTEGTEIDASYADGWNGLGWAYAKLGVADTSSLRFTTAATKSDTTIVMTEILAGRSFARLALALFSGAVSDAKAALVLTPTWEFRRDVSVTYEDLRLTVATGFYSLGEFDSSLVWVQKLDSEFTANVNTMAGRSQLAAKLEALEAILQE